MKLLRFVDEIMQKSFAIQRRHRTEPSELQVIVWDEETGEQLPYTFDYDQFEEDGPTYLMLVVRNTPKRRGTFTRE